MNIPNIEGLREFPDLLRDYRRDYQQAAGPGCANCEGQTVVRRYVALLDSRRRLTPKITRPR